MKKPDFFQLIQLAANLGVIAGIVFLALELQQNNDLLEADARASRAQVRISALDLLTNNPTLLTAQAKEGRGEPLTDLEHNMLAANMESVLTRWQYAYGEWQAGLIDEADVPVENWHFVMAGSATMQQVWSDIGQFSFRPDFVAWMNENVARP